jgi:cell division protein FtsB
MTETAGTISGDELRQRVAVLKRFRELLKAQRDRFRAYLELLDKQKDIIEEGAPEELISHVEMEEKIVADIFSIQRVIDPLEDMYRRIHKPSEPGAGGDDVPSLKSALAGLQAEAAARSRRNKDLLSKRMMELRSEIKSLRSNPYTSRRPGYAQSASSRIDLKG